MNYDRYLWDWKLELEQELKRLNDRRREIETQLKKINVQLDIDSEPEILVPTFESGALARPVGRSIAYPPMPALNPMPQPDWIAPTSHYATAYASGHYPMQVRLPEMPITLHPVPVQPAAPPRSRSKAAKIKSKSKAKRKAASQDQDTQWFSIIAIAAVVGVILFVL